MKMLEADPSKDNPKNEEEFRFRASRLGLRELIDNDVISPQMSKSGVRL